MSTLGYHSEIFRVISQRRVIALCEIVKLASLRSVLVFSLALALLPILNRIGADDASARGPEPRAEVDQHDEPAYRLRKPL